MAQCCTCRQGRVVMVKKKYIPKCSDVVWTDFDPAAGHEQMGKRPALVLSPAPFNKKICWLWWHRSQTGSEAMVLRFPIMTKNAHNTEVECFTLPLLHHEERIHVDCYLNRIPGLMQPVFKYQCFHKSVQEIHALRFYDHLPAEAVGNP